MDSTIEYAFTTNGYLLIHFNGTVIPMLSRFPDKGKVVAKFKAIAASYPITLEELAEVATAALKNTKSHWGVQDYAVNMTKGMRANHPVKDHETDVATIIMDLNDCHGWTREQIADWLDTLPEQPVFKLDVDIVTAEDLM
jgi:hypothetical protein